MTGAAILPGGYSLLSFDEVDSTNDEARRRMDAGAGAGTVITALRQTAGKGRRGREWISPAGNLYFSVILEPRCPVARAAEISFVAALALGEAVAPLLPAGIVAAYKWPNDLLLGGKKAAGILLESQGRGRGIADWLIVGVGINIAGYPDDTEFPATSLAAAGCRPESPQAILGAFVGKFDAWLGRWRDDGFAPVREAWLKAAAGVGEPITVRLESDTITGIFRTLDSHGALELDGEGGQTHVISAGDVFFPPAG